MVTQAKHKQNRRNRDHGDAEIISACWCRYMPTGRFKEFFDGAASWSRVERITRHAGRDGSEAPMHTLAHRLQRLEPIRLRCWRLPVASRPSICRRNVVVGATPRM